ncbi:alpha/beta hydrolase [Paenibacillus sp. MZ04-78.2]|uniref:alpha/beta fold hydrolase n=1 Tax=Paenibacillus sp. MZ04-78.2 TaxID=2962034 RepID=UPI0020B74441|nr:alpha/beta fold hydrolase [Paenibacillus sp. MZ04-78.2]MCP3772962.1 alpha/beta hydrolase [Paenibacillus sp. MZ04-78.2]
MTDPIRIFANRAALGASTGTPKTTKPRGAVILWLAGWSMPETVFAELQSHLPEFIHVPVRLNCAETPEQMIAQVEAAAIAWIAEWDSTHPRFPTTSRRSRKLLIAGWSLGGLLALRLAAQGFADALVLFGATARFVRSGEESDRGWPDAVLRHMAAAIAKDRLAVEAQFRERLLSDGEKKAGLLPQLPRTGSWPTAALLAGIQLLRTANHVPDLPEIACPTLLVHGKEDKVCPYGAAEELYERLPQADILPVEGGGHIPFLAREAAIAETIRRWWHGAQAAFDSPPV